jgi:hypothetical protein
MRNESEYEFGRTLMQLVAHLLKNAEKVPEPVMKAALEFEAFTWEKLDDATKRTCLRQVAELTDAPSAVHRHMEAYPHQFSKKRYAEYLSALTLYKESLGL